MSTPNTTPLTYNSWFQQIATLAVESYYTSNGIVCAGSSGAPDVNFQTAMAQALNTAELRIQRDLDLYGLETTDSSNYQTTQGGNILSFDANEFIVVDTIMVNNIPLLPVARAFLQNVYGPGSTQGPPEYFAPVGGDTATGGATTQNYMLGPIPDQSYPVTVSGKFRSPSLASFAAAGATAAGSSYTFISAYLPDLLIAASMVYISGYQRNFGAQSDDSGNAVSWDGAYKTLLEGAMTEEARRKLQAAAWSPAPPAPLATPNRGV